MAGSCLTVQYLEQMPMAQRTVRSDRAPVRVVKSREARLKVGCCRRGSLCADAKSVDKRESSSAPAHISRMLRSKLERPKAEHNTSSAAFWLLYILAWL
jgi:hypothetical protein